MKPALLINGAARVLGCFLCLCGGPGCVNVNISPWPEVPEHLRACVPSPQSYQACTVLESAAATALRGVGLDSTEIAYIARGYRQVLFGRPLWKLAQGDPDPHGLSFIFARIAHVRDAARSDGTYAVTQSTGALTIHTYGPDGGDAIEHDILALESYFEGARLNASATLEQSAQSLDDSVSFTLSWDARGPLADAIDPEQQLTSPLMFDASFNDLASSRGIDGLEPFDAILDFEADWVEDGTLSDAHVSAAKSGTTDTQLTWHCSGERLSLRKRIHSTSEAVGCELSGSRERIKLTGNPQLKSSNGLLKGSAGYELKLPGSTRVEIKDSYATSDGDNPSYGSDPTSSAWTCHK